MPPRLRLVPIYCSSQQEIIGPLADTLEERFGVRVEHHLPDFEPEDAFDASRGQYNSRVLLAKLLDGGGEERVLGITTVDLFIPVLTYVFGEAQLGGRAAVVSSHRLAQEVYGLPPDPPLLLERLRKVVIHELGHTYGLPHCHRSRCIMQSSTAVEGVDLKPDTFCNPCYQRLVTAAPDVETQRKKSRTFLGSF